MQSKAQNRFQWLWFGGCFLMLIQFVNYILDNKLDEVSPYVIIRDYTLITIMLAPSWLLVKPMVLFLNKKEILANSFSLRFIRNIALAILITIPGFFMRVLIRYVLYAPDDDPASQKFTAIFLINFILVQLIEYYHYFLKEKDAQIQQEKDARKLLKAEHDMLKEQVNPHFLFNSLNVLSSLIFIDQEKANQYTKELSKLYRYILNANQHSTVALESELKFIKSYFYILHLRFGEAIQLEIVKHEESNGEIVPLTLQLLLENAQKHNAFHTEKPLRIKVEIYRHELIVSNKLMPKPTEESDGVGVRYIRTLYQNLGMDIQIDVSNGEYITKVPIIT